MEFFNKKNIFLITILSLAFVFSMFSGENAKAAEFSCWMPVSDPDQECIDLVSNKAEEALLECKGLCPDPISGVCALNETTCPYFSCETPDLGCIDLVSSNLTKAKLKCDKLCSDPAVVDLCKFKHQFCLKASNYSFWANEESGKSVCQEIGASNILGAKRLVAFKTSLIYPYDGVTIKNIEDLAIVTKLTEGKCPSASMKQDTYHCFVISGVDKFKAGDCREIQAANPVDAADKAKNLCASNKAEADSMLYKTDVGPCPGVPSAGKSAKELLATAARELNPAGISQPTDLIGKAIKLLMAFMGSISLVLYVYAGILWLSASGASERVDKAKKVIVWTTLGVVVMLGSYMLVSFVFESLGL